MRYFDLEALLTEIDVTETTTTDLAADAVFVTDAEILQRLC